METRSFYETVKEYGRGVIGGLLFSLPLLYTMEVWWTGFIASPEKLLVFIVFTFLLLMGYNRYAGMRKGATLKDILHESVEEITLGFIVAFLFLLLIDKINFSMSFDEIAGKVIVETMMVAIGVSVGTAQLGQNDKENNGKEKSKRDNSFLKMLILSICGAVLISSSIAPTEEILQIAIISKNIHLFLMIVTALVASAIILFFSDFKGTGSLERGIRQVVSHVTINYAIALAISYILLWIFGRTGGYSFYIIIAQMVVLSIPAAIGASAGRLLIDNK